MIRTRSAPVLAAALLAACGGGSEKPGARLRGPGPMAIFSGLVKPHAATQRLYLAVGNERGDELRLIDLADDKPVESPGIAFPLSIPTPGAPMFVASASLNDGGPDALVVIAEGASEVSLIDTWSGEPTVVAPVPLGVGVQALSMIAVPIPGTPRKCRVLVSLAGGDLAVIDLSRDDPSAAILAPAAASAVLPLGFEAVSLAPGALGDGYVWAASHDLITDATHTLGVYGVAKIDLPANLAGWLAADDVTAYDTLAPTELVVAAKLDPWEFPSPGIPQDDTWLTGAERLVAVPVPTECGPEKTLTRCGLLAVDPAAAAVSGRGNLVAGPTPDVPYLIPIAFPGSVTGLALAGRSDATAGANQLPLLPAAASTGLVAVTTTDGGTYLVDLARWTVASSTDPVTGDGRTRVSSAFTDGAAGTVRIGLWGLGGPPPLPAVEKPTTRATELVARVRVTPGFTPDDDWTLTYQGVLPGLELRAAEIGNDGSPWLAVQIDVGGSVPAGVAELAPPKVAVGDLVEIGGGTNPCPAGTELEVASFVNPAPGGPPGGAVRLRAVGGGSAPACVSTIGTTVATFRASGLVLVGARTGYVGRPTPSETKPVDNQGTEQDPDYVAVDQPFAGPRLFYVTDPCPDASACASLWRAPNAALYTLTFPYPDGRMLGLSPVYVLESGKPVVVSTTPTPPERGTALHFTTRSGLTPAARRPIIDGTAIDSTMPMGIVLRRDQTADGQGIVGFVSYTGGLVMKFNTSEAADKVKVIR